MNTWKTLVRREFWEHRGLWIAPPVAGLFLILATMFGAMNLQRHAHELPSGGWEQGQKLWFFTSVAVGGLIFMMIAISLFGYLLESLYGERKDRSILFWRSLPVSDRQTVLSKYLVAMGVMPLYGWLIVVLTHTICSALMLAFMPEAGAQLTAAWTWSGWLQANAMLLYLVAASVLWYAPVASWLLLASAFARRSPFLYAFFPPAVLLAVESVVFNSRELRTYLAQRLTLPFSISRHTGIDSVAPAALLMNPQLWYGLVAAAAMLALAVRLRRYRDDT